MEHSYSASGIDLPSEEKRTVQLQIVQHFLGHFRLSTNNEKLIDAFCGSVVTEFSMAALEEHIWSEEHQTAITKCQLAKEKPRRKSKSETAKFEKFASEPNENSSNELVLHSNVNVDYKRKSSFDKVKTVQAALNLAMFSDDSDEEQHTVRCNKCSEIISDSLSVMAQHAHQHQNEALTTAKIQGSLTPGIIGVVNNCDQLKIIDSSVWCIVCHQSFSNNKKSIIDKHLKSATHNSQIVVHHKRNSVDECINQKQFCQWLTCTLSASDIAFNKIAEMSNFLSIFTGRIIPSEPTLRRYLDGSYNIVKDEVQKCLREKMLWISIDEATNSLQHTKFAVVIIGTLDPDNHTSQLIVTWKYEEVKGSWDTDAVVSLFLRVLEEVYGENDYLQKAKQCVKIFVSDAGTQMTAAARRIKAQHLPNLLTFTCLCHALHNLCESIMKLYSKAMAFVCALNNALFSSPPKVAFLRTMPGFKKLPPVIIPSRWGIAMRALKYWYDNLQMATAFLKNYHHSESKYIIAAKTLMTKEAIAELKEVSVRYSFIPDVITKLETRNLPMQTSIDLINRVCDSLLAFKGNFKGDSVITRFNGILNRNKQFVNFQTLLNDDNFKFLKYAPAGSFEAERSIKYFKRMLAADRSRLKFETTAKKCFIKSNAIALKLRSARPSNREEIEGNAYLSIRPSFGTLFDLKQEYSITVDNEVEISELSESEIDGDYNDDYDEVDDDIVLYEEVQFPTDVE